MKKTFILLTILMFLGVAGKSQDPGWPRQLTNQGANLVCYQPQVERWDNFTAIEFRMAFTLNPAKGKTHVGVLDIQSATEVNISTHMVTMYNMMIKGIHFPGLSSDSAAMMEKVVRRFLPNGYETTISLDRLVASTSKTKPASTVKVKNDPPVIFVSYGPAIMVQVDGTPVYASIGKTALQFIVNTNWPLFLDTYDSSYYLCSNQVWFKAAALGSPWVPVTTLPGDFTKIKSNPDWSDLKDAIPPKSLSGITVQSVYYSGVPSEIIVFKGSPKFELIAGTDLQYAGNTSSDVFLQLPERMFYCLFSGRWFRSNDLQGPWSFATPDLPKDFKKIPYSSPASRVLSSVPGTEDAEDAVLIAQIPTTVKINPASADSFASVTYNGVPAFKPIEGTPLYYADNTPEKVIKADDLYYLCLQGIWFVANSASGPWQVAQSIPDVIYTIPPSSPVYNVTFVTQTVAPDGFITASYTAGYTGVFIVGTGPDLVLAMGTGFYYPPCFIYPPFGFPLYYPCAMTYGYAAFGYHPYCGVSFGVSFNYHTGYYSHGVNAYGPYGRATVGQAYNPYTGTFARGGSVSTPYGTRSSAEAYNPRTGASAMTRQGSSPYGQWGSSVVSNGHGQSAVAGHASNATGSVAAGATSSGGKAVAGHSAYGSGGAVKTSGGDMYAAKDGNIYKNTNGNWSQANGNHSQFNQGQSHPDAQSFSRQDAGGGMFGGLNDSFQDRQRGGFQTDQFQRSGGWSGGGRSGGGWGGGFGGGFGGGGRRR